MKSTTDSLKALLLLATIMFAACQTEDVPPFVEGAQTGRIVLSVPEIQVFTEGTRADGNIADYTYKLNKNGSPIQDVTFENGVAIIPAGTYTLTATSSTAQDEAPWYQGTSGEFTLTVGGTTEVTINLGKPKNVEIVVTFDDTFTTLYENYSVTIGSKSVSDDGNLYAMPDSEEEISYTIKGSAQAGSHVSDIPASGITGKITNAKAGTSYSLNITAKAIEDLRIDFGGEHTGEFDTKEYRPLNQNNEAKATIYMFDDSLRPRVERRGVGE